MEELRDIQGLDYISMWPLAIGWWFVLGLIFAGILVGMYLAYKRWVYKKSWQYSSYMMLQKLQEEISKNKAVKEGTQKLLVDQLAVEIRRIAMAKTTRRSCAGLTGMAWLLWLAEHDPRGFAWDQQGQLLISAQYMPLSSGYDLSQVQNLISAAKQWVKKC